MAALPTTGATGWSDGGLVSVSFIYDAGQNPPPITSVDVVNNDTQSRVVGVNFYSNAAGNALLWSGSRSCPVGTTVLDVSGLNQHMVSYTGKYGTTWAFPVVVSCS
jgi:hypothetical protein